MLQGKKVNLRAIEQEDLVRLHQFNNDLAVEVAGGGDPPMPQSLARLQAEYESNWQNGGRDGMNFAIEVEGKFVGICALFYHNVEARACGFVEEGRLRQHVWSDGAYIDLIHMGILRHEWEASDVT